MKLLPATLLGALGAFLLAAAAAADTATATTAVAAPPPVEHFFQREQVTGAQLSPDGRLVAFKMAAKSGHVLAVLDLATMKPTVAASFKDGSIHAYRWVNDTRLVFDLEVELTRPGMTNRGSGLFAANADGTGFRQLVDTLGSFVLNGDADDKKLLPWNTYLLPGAPRAGGDDVFVVVPEAEDYIDLARVDTNRGRLKPLDTPRNAVHWLFDAAGEPRVVVTAKGRAVALHVRQGDGSWRKLREAERFVGADLSPSFIAPDGTLYVSAAGPHGKEALYTLDTGTNRLSERPLLASADFSIHATPVMDTRRLLGLRFVVDGEVTQWLDSDMKALQEHVDKILPVTTNRLTPPQHGDSPWVLVQSFSDTQPEITYVLQRQTRKLVKVGAALPRVEPRQLGSMDFVKIKARDGLTIPTYLTLPKGKAQSPRPMVVLVHGGPWVRGQSWRWNAEVQFLASRGYVVLQPEFRGSTGYGHDHFKAGWKRGAAPCRTT